MDMTFQDALAVAEAANDKLAEFIRRIARPHLNVEGWAEIPVPRSLDDQHLDLAVRAWVEVEMQGLAQIAFAYRASAITYEQVIGKEALSTLVELGMLHRLVNGNLHPTNVEMMVKMFEWGEMLPMAQAAWSERKVHFETLSLIPAT